MIFLQKQTGSSLFRVLGTMMMKRTGAAYFSETSDISDLKSCWFCSKKNPVSKHECGTCEMVQKPERTIKDMDFFEIFKRYEIDKKRMEREYRKLQMQLHPDKFSFTSNNNFGTVEEAIKYSETISSLINQAYAVLSEDFKRAEYIVMKFILSNLLTNDIATVEQQNEGRKTNNYGPRVFRRDFREERPCAGTDDKAELEKLKSENESNLKQGYEELAKLLNSNQFEEAADLLEKIKYFHSIENAIVDREEKEAHNHSQ